MAGLYEQIINQLFKAKLEKYDRKIYHIGMKEIGRDEAIQYLSRYLYALIQSTIDDVAQQENGVEKCIQFTNDVIKELGEKFAIENYEDDLVDASNSILTSVIDKRSAIILIYRSIYSESPLLLRLLKVVFLQGQRTL